MRRHSLTARPLTAAVACALLAACGDSAGPRSSSDHAAGAGLILSSWQPMSQSPLSARHSPLAVALAGKVLFIGGRDTPRCGDSASCGPPSRAALRDGAAYDPTTDSWTRLSPSPLPLAAGETTTAVVGTTAYFLSTRVVPSPNKPRPVLTHTFIAYDPGADRWATLPTPTDSKHFLRLAALGQRVAVYPGSHAEPVAESPFAAEDPLPPDFLFDPATGGWSELPADPGRPSYDREFYSVGNSAVLLSSALREHPGDQPPRTQASVLEPTATGGYAWRGLPPGETLGAYGFHAVGNKLVNVGEQSADGGAVNNWGRRVHEAWALDVAAGTWTELPTRPASIGQRRTVDRPVGGARFVAGGNWLYDASDGSWLSIWRPPDAIADKAPFASESRTPAWIDTYAGGSLLIWGGDRWQGKSATDGVAELRANGWRLDVTVPTAPS